MNELSGLKWFLANSLINFHRIIYVMMKRCKFTRPKYQDDHTMYQWYVRGISSKYKLEGTR